MYYHSFIENLLSTKVIIVFVIKILEIKQLKKGKRFEQTFLKRTYKNGQ